MLNKYAEIQDNQYVQKQKGVPAFAMVGQRLYTGRVAVAQAALSYQRRLFEVTKAYSDSKMCWSKTGEVPLSNIPQLKSLYEEQEATTARLDLFVSRCEAELSHCLVSDTLPSSALVEAIASAKVKAVEASIDLTFRLKQEVGSFALMADAGFKHMDFLQCCKFAEGDSRILMQKLARDCMQRSRDPTDERELAARDDLIKAMEASVAKGLSQQEAWDDSWRQVYALAGATIDRIVDTYTE